MIENLIEQATVDLLSLEIDTKKDLDLAKRKIAKKYNISILSNTKILEIIKNKESRVLGTKKKIKNLENIKKILRRRAIRTMSGVAPVAVLTKPFDCPGKCAYCPTEKNVPQSYLSNEPAVMRAIRCHYDPYIQVQDRLRALEKNGHHPTKIEIIVIGGTWSVFPRKYKYWYIANCFAAANDFRKNSKTKVPKQTKILDLKKFLKKEQTRNENSKYQIIGLTLETRPDYIDKKELIEMRELGCTRVEIGVQAICDQILVKNKRGHGVAEIKEATALLRSYGFKITYHFMPGLPGSDLTKDLEMFTEIFENSAYRPDQIKFYPTVVTRGSLLYKWWRAGKYTPYTTEELSELIAKCKKIVPRYVRIIRLIRDIPGESIIAGNLVTNLRQIIQQKNIKCNCIRCREANIEDKIYKPKLIIENYPVSGGEEYFISYENLERNLLYGFARLFLPKKKSISSIVGNKDICGDVGNKDICSPQVLNNAAIIRELHIYGELVPIGKNKKIQHAGLGKKLLEKCEEIARINKYPQIAIISGVGVRNYYRKQRYRLRESYMVKNF